MRGASVADNVLANVFRHARSNAAGLAVADGSRALSWAELAEKVKHRAEQLAPLPAAVAMHRPADIGWLVDLLAGWRHGRLVLPYSATLPRATVLRDAAALGVTALIGEPSPDPSQGTTVSAMHNREIALPQAELVSVHPQAPATWATGSGLVHFTSGTTGEASGVIRDDASLMAEAVAVAEAANLTRRTPILCGTPVSHSFASGLLMAALTVGSTVLLVPRFEPSLIVRMAHDYLPRVLCATPYVLRSLLRTNDARHRALAEVAVPIVGGAPLRSDLAQQWHGRFSHPVVQEYGLSECGIVTLNLEHAAQVPTSVGRPISGVGVQVVDDAGGRLGSGRVGRVVVTQRSPAGPYVHMGSQTRPLPQVQVRGRAAVDTGDLGRFDAHGLLYLVDRRKSLINVDGTKVLPRAIEHALCLVNGVNDAVVVGIPDEYRGESVAAMVEVSRPVEVAELVAHLRSEVSSPMVPRRWLVVSEMPRTSSGKPDVAAVRSRFHERRVPC